VSLLSPLLLPSDVELVPVGDLAEETRRRLAGPDDAWALTRRGLRSGSLVIEASAAELVRAFRTPRTLCDAVIAIGKQHGPSVEDLLEASFPLIERLLAEGFLVEADHPAAASLGPSLRERDQFGRFRILCLLRALADVEVYQASDTGAPETRAFGQGLVALKLARNEAVGHQLTNLRHETAILDQLTGLAPAVVGSGSEHGREYLALAWQTGVDVSAAAAELREANDAHLLLRMATNILLRYSALHERGVVHGDVHPSNILIDAQGDAHLLDFGAAIAGEGSHDGARVGVGFFFEPELARAMLAESCLPPPTPRGEQHALGALLTLILTGRHYLDFSLERTALLTQIVETPPILLIPTWLPSRRTLREILERMLSKRPEDRFASVRDIAQALRDLPAEREAIGRAVPPRSGPRLLSRVRADLLPGGRWLGRSLDAPHASVHNGMAGIAYGLLRLAQTTDDPELLAAADLWSLEATAASADEDAFVASALGLSLDVIGCVAPAHTASGPPLVEAWIAHARGDQRGFIQATERFVATASSPCRRLDLTLGRSGVLWAAADLAARGQAPLVEDLGSRTLETIWEELDRHPEIAAARALPNLGVAHGWAGYLYATARWCRAVGAPLPPEFGRRLSELRDLAIPSGRGCRWQWDGAEAALGEIASMPGWCNGSAGLLHLFTLTAEMGVDAQSAAVAEAAAWNTWEAEGAGFDLCCGLAGRAYALLNFAQRLGGAPWLGKARQLAERAARACAADRTAPIGLYRGTLGVALLQAEIEQPDRAAMPFFGDEGWGGLSAPVPSTSPISPIS
jgi:hypothetical protein